MKTLSKIALGLSFTLGGITPVLAHYLWIEQAPVESVKLYFGEIQEGVREVSGGRLDSIRELKAWTSNADGARQEMTVTQQPEYFDLGKAKSAGPVLAESLATPVREPKKAGDVSVKPLYYTRFNPASGISTKKPELMLDILPEAGSTDALTVYFNNAPLPQAKVLVYAPNLWMQEHTTDESGKIKINTPWAGRYVVDVAHKVEKPGEFEGKKFATTSHRSTLSLEVAAGAK